VIEIVGVDPDYGYHKRILGRVFSKIDHNLFSVEFNPSDTKCVRLVAAASDFKSMTGVSTPFRKARGYRYECERGPVIPTYDFTYVAKGNMHLLPIVMWDFKQALREQGWEPVSWPTEDLILRPNPAEFEDWCKESRHSSYIVHDIETPRSNHHDDDDDDVDPSYQILRFSLARDDFHSITAPYQEPFISLVKELMGEPMPKVGWNSSYFDDDREAANGWPMVGKRIDAMWLWHFLQSTFPRSLGTVTTFYDRVPEWKSLGSAGDNEELYSAMDSREEWKCFVGIKKSLEARTI
jgi:hypothetical protein